MRRIFAVIVALTISLCFPAYAGKIADYEYDKLDEKLFFANRSG